MTEIVQAGQRVAQHLPDPVPAATQIVRLERRPYPVENTMSSSLRRGRPSIALYAARPDAGARRPGGAGSGTVRTCSVGWIGDVIAYIGLGVAATRGETPDTVRAAWTAMEIVGWYVLTPLALGSWATGLVKSLGTRWGLFRYYWVLFAFVLTTLATVTLILHMPDVSSVVDAVRTAEPTELDQYGGDLFHPRRPRQSERHRWASAGLP